MLLAVSIIGVYHPHDMY